MTRVVTPTGALRAGYAVLMVLVCAVLVAGGAVLYTNRVAQQAAAREAVLREQADRRWCDLFRALDPRAPTTNERGRLIQQEMQRLYERFRCEEVR